MNIIIHSSIALCTPSRAILYDEAEKYTNEGHQVSFMYCDRLMNVCLTNPNGSEADCVLCCRNYRSEKKKLNKKIKFISLREYVLENAIELDDVIFDYSSVDEIKRLKYGGVSIGLAALSTYISITRNLSPLINDDFKYYFNQLLNSSAKLTVIFRKIFNSVKFDLVCLYNGRLSDSRPVWELAKLNNINFVTYESIVGTDRMYKTVSYNTIPHMIEAKTEFINKLWEDKSVSYKEKEILGRLFYERRRNSEVAGDNMIFTKRQKDGLLPDNWNSTIRNIVFYISSEDEFAAVWDDMCAGKIFESQIDALHYIAELFKNRKDFNFYIRIHPNLLKIEYNYHLDLYRFNEYDNFFVIPADSPISSYSLLDAAEKIIVSGSTIGIEAVYWGKPVILLSPADYYQLNACYVPDTKKNIYGLIVDYLEPKTILPALQYGYSFTNKKWDDFAFIDFSTEALIVNIGFYKRIVIVDNWLKLLGSRILYSGRKFLIQKILRILYPTKMSIPTREI